MPRAAGGDQKEDFDGEFKGYITQPNVNKAASRCLLAKGTQLGSLYTHPPCLSNTFKRPSNFGTLDVCPLCLHGRGQPCKEVAFWVVRSDTEEEAGRALTSIPLTVEFRVAN